MARHRPQHLTPPTPRPPRQRAVVVALVVLSAAGLTTTAWLLGRPEPAAVVTATPIADDTASTSVTSSPTTTAPTTTTTAAPRSARLLFGGDVLIHQPVWQAAAVADGHDFTPMLAPIEPLVRPADLALCHLEVTLARPGEPPSGYPRFRAPAALATDLAAAGFDGCSVASNHALDFGEGGVVATLDGLAAAGLGHAGTARSPEEDLDAARYEPGGIAVAHLSYAYGFNGLRPPAGREWLVDEIDPAVILDDAARARAEGAEVVVVSLHWGNEYDHDVTDAQRAVAEALAADAGAVDLVVGHHAHVVQPISQVGDLWVVWGLGNMLSNNSPSCCTTAATDGLLVSVTFADRPGGAGVALTDIAYTPVWNERAGYRVLPAAEAVAAGVDPALAAALRASHDRTTIEVRALLGDDPRLRPTATLPSG
ncbi:MAG: CapA family protein [Acidimicrobiales bacterium]